MKAVVYALKEYPTINSMVDEAEQTIIVKKYYNLGFAVGVDEGLMVPIIKMVQDKKIIDIAKEISDLAEKARSRTIDLADLKGGTFSITNYGSIGGTYGFPIPNYPEIAILGVGRIMELPRVINGKIVVRKILPLSLTFDHRAVDGAYVASFLKTLIGILEDPDRLMLEY